MAAAAAARAGAGQRAGQRDGYTQVLADDRGHLLPAVPRSKASPWGTFLGTWDMPLSIPPAKLSLTGRSAAAAAQLRSRLRAAAALAAACNGLRTAVTGQPQEPRPEAQAPGKPRSQDILTRSEGLAVPQPEMPREAEAEEEEEEALGAEAAAPLCRKLGRLDLRPKEDGAAAEPPASRQPRSARKARARADSPAEVPLSRQAAFTDLRLRDALPPPAQAAGPAQPAWLPPSRPGSVGAEAKVGRSPPLLGSPGPAEAGPQGPAVSPAAGAASRARKATAKRDKSVSPERDGWSKLLPRAEDRAGQTAPGSARPGPRVHF